MKVFLTSDANWETGAGNIVSDLSGPMGDYFSRKRYGTGLRGIAVVLMCRDPRLKFHRRLRLSRRDKIIYMDIMLDYAEMTAAKKKRQRSIVIEKLRDEVSWVLEKYATPGFDRKRFVAEFAAWLKAAASLPYLKTATSGPVMS